ncbi:MAG: hypothetical protein V1703_00420, partial [Candidatus Altiarchaeota archaeon]
YLTLLVLLGMLFAISYLHLSTGGCACSDINAPVFNDPSAKLAELSNPNFTLQLYLEATALEPLLNQSGTQVHMGFWSAKGNHGGLVRLLDDINYYSSGGEEVQRAVWDEGTQSSLQYPSYVKMNSQEHWYERATSNGSMVLIHGVEYADSYSVSIQQADEIWGEYSERYADMAVYFKEATGKKVQAWCYVENAKANRIFYTYEYPELEKLEKEGVVEVHFAKTQDADWKNPEDWITGTENAPMPT